jgi:hypothetical protein
MIHVRSKAFTTKGTKVHEEVHGFFEVHGIEALPRIQILLVFVALRVLRGQSS